MEVRVWVCANVMLQHRCFFFPRQFSCKITLTLISKEAHLSLTVCLCSHAHNVHVFQRIEEMVSTDSCNKHYSGA